MSNPSPLGEVGGVGVGNGWRGGGGVVPPTAVRFGFVGGAG